jgi:hypothetical protein
MRLATAPILLLAAAAHAAPPVAPELSAAFGFEDRDVSVTLPAEDPDGDDLIWEILAAPASGALLGTGRVRVFRPEPNFNGRSWVSYRACDASACSAPAWVTIDVRPAQDPVAPAAQVLKGAEDAETEIALRAEAAPGVRVLWQVLAGPSNGTLSGEAVEWASEDPSLIYTPEPDWYGVDHLLVGAWDLGSPAVFTAEIAIEVLPRPDAPPAVEALAPAQGETVGTVHPVLQWTPVVDVDGDALRYGARVWDAATHALIAEVAGVEAESDPVAWRVDVPLEHGRVYAWQAWADDRLAAGAPSARTLFRVDPDNAPPTGLLPIFPRTGDVVSSTSPIVWFEAATDPEGAAARHELVIALEGADPLVGSIDANGGEQAWDLAAAGLALPRFSTAVLRMRAVDPGGASSPWISVPFQVTGPNCAPPTPTVARLDEAAADCWWALDAPDPDGDPVAFELSLDANEVAERTPLRADGAAIVACPVADGVEHGAWVRAIDAHGAASMWVWQGAIAPVASGCDQSGGAGVGLGLLWGLVALALRRR